MKRAHSYRLIEEAFVVDNLSAECIPLADIQLNKNLPRLNQCHPLGDKFSQPVNKEIKIQLEKVGFSLEVE